MPNSDVKALPSLKEIVEVLPNILVILVCRDSRILKFVVDADTHYRNKRHIETYQILPSFNL